jgi:maltose-binding protein MalE
MRGWLRSKKFWGGAAAGMIAGPWAVNQVRRITGVGLSLPKVGNGG